MLAEWPAGYGGFHLETEKGELLPIQRTFDGKALFYASDMPGMGYAVFRIRQGELPAAAMPADRSGTENAYIRLRFSPEGQICSIYDREADRELLPEGAVANCLESYEDRPHCYDAWELESYYKEKSWPVGAPERFSLLEAGPHRVVYQAEYRYLDSCVEQRMIVYARERRIDFVTAADWHEQHILLKAAFPTNLLAANATYEIQFGTVERPAHLNTSWDAARFETCAHKWADLSEDGYGAALLNDCKYGYDIHEGVLRLSLIKAATFPNEAADQGRHEFTYSFLPHAGGWREAGVSRQAYDLNVPLKTRFLSGTAEGLPPRFGWLECQEPNIVAEVLKPAEDGNGLIARLFETFGRRSRCTVKVAGPAREAWECDLLERRQQPLPLTDGLLSLTFKPYEIKTVRLITKA